jgi:hypothetical protein
MLVTTITVMVPERRAAVRSPLKSPVSAAVATMTKNFAGRYAK